MQDMASDVSGDMGAVTQRLASFVTAVRSEDVTARAKTWATHALLDWAGVTLAARDEPAVQMLVDELCGDAVDGPTTLIGQGRKEGCSTPC